MHLAEGVLPAAWAAATTGLALPLVLKGGRDVKALVQRQPQVRPLLGLLGAGIFAVSALPIPVPVAGAVSHPTGTALAAIILRPSRVVAISAVVLAIQALLMAHGGITTWGSNVLTMGVVGSFAAYFTFRGLLSARAPLWIAAGAAGMVGDFSVYLADAAILAAALGDPTAFGGKFLTITALFSPTQVPIAVLEGIATAMAFSYLRRRRPDLFLEFAVAGVATAAPAVSGLGPATAGRRVMGQLWWIPALGFFAAAVGGLGAAATRWEGTDVGVFVAWAVRAGANPSGQAIPISAVMLLYIFAAAGFAGGFAIAYFVTRLRRGPPTDYPALSPGLVMAMAAVASIGLILFLGPGLQGLGYRLQGDLELFAFAGVGLIGGAAVGGQFATLTSARV